MEKEPVIEYKNKDITVVWKPKICVHSQICWRGLGEVFKPLEKQWIKMDGATTDRIIKQVCVCPSGALSYYVNEDQK